MLTRDFYEILAPRTRFFLLSAIFFIFAPIALLVISNIGHGWSWIDIAGWMIGSAIIATTWAYAAFKHAPVWIPITVNMLIPVAQATLFSGSISTGNFGVTVTGVLIVLSIAIGYVMLVIFIRGEGARTVHLFTEMQLAKEIHDHLVPEVHFCDDRYEILGSSSASSEVGGDLLDLSHRNNSHLVTVADVSGHGVRAGVLMAMIKGALKTKLLSSESDAISDDLNSVVYTLKRPDMYATGILLELFPDHRVKYTGAGHPALLHIQRNNSICANHPSQNPPLGVVPGILFAKTELVLQPGDLLVLVTDGITEVENESGEMFGEERVQQLFRSKSDKSLPELRSALLAAVYQFGKQVDDQTLVLIRAL
jgi:hypothetical protein